MAKIILGRVVGPEGPEGPPGPDGAPASLSIGIVQEGADANATITGDVGNQKLNLTLPRGAEGQEGPEGPAGPANNLSIGTVQEGTDANASITGTAGDQQLNLVLPRGAEGPEGPVGPVGPANKLSIGTVTVGEAAASISGEPGDQQLNLVLPSESGFALTKDGSGFIELDTSELVFDKTEKSVTIRPATGHSEFSYYFQGKEVKITEPVKYILATNELNKASYISFSEDTGNLVNTGEHPDFNNTALVFYVYYSTKDNDFVIEGDERHSAKRNMEWHISHHIEDGMQLRSGSALQYTTGSTTDNKFGFNGGFVVADEDLVHTIVNAATPSKPFEQNLAKGAAKIPMLVLTEGIYSQDFVSLASDKTCFYNNFQNSTGVSDVPVGKVVNYFIVATNCTKNPIKVIPGRNTFNNAGEASREPLESLGLSFAELVVLYRVCMKQVTALTMQIDTVDIVNHPAGGYNPHANIVNHSQLTGRNEGIQHDSKAVLYKGEKTVAAALDEIYLELNPPAPPSGHQVFTSNGTFTPPAGVTKVSVIVVGGGGGGGSLNYQNPESKSGANGATSSFGTLVTANGGKGGEGNMQGGKGGTGGYGGGSSLSNYGYQAAGELGPAMLDRSGGGATGGAAGYEGGGGGGGFVGLPYVATTTKGEDSNVGGLEGFDGGYGGTGYGAGAGGDGENYEFGAGAGAGGSGYFKQATVNVAAGTPLTVTVGKGGSNKPYTFNGADGIVVVMWGEDIKSYDPYKPNGGGL